METEERISRHGVVLGTGAAALALAATTAAAGDKGPPEAANEHAARASSGR